MQGKDESFETKVYITMKYVPLVGRIYRFGRDLVTKKEKDKHSAPLDLADLNPVRWIRGVATGIQAARHNLNEGIWIGKRPLLKKQMGNPIGITVSPNFDVYHWGILVKGKLYHIAGLGEGGKSDYDVENTDDSKEIETFLWVWIDDDKMVKADHESIMDFINEKKNSGRYSLITSPSPNSLAKNCQQLTADILQHVGKLTDVELTELLYWKMGSLFF